MNQVALAERFWSKVDKTESCWNWIGARNPRGYGVFSIGQRRTALAHRVAVELATGIAPAAGMVVCHRCDNPQCVRPDHLFEGTNLDNVRDMQAKGRVSHSARLTGERHHQAKLTAEQVRSIRLARRSGALRKDIACRYGISLDMVSRITTGRNWRCLEDDQ